MLANLTAPGIGRLFAEGGTMIHTHLTSRRSDLAQYLKAGSPRASVATPLFLDSRAPPRPLPPRPGTPNVASQVWLTLTPTCRAWAARFA
jgi:hypothetical protein